MNIIPRPSSVKLAGEGKFCFGKKTEIVCPLPAAAAVLKKCAEASAASGGGVITFVPEKTGCDYRLTVTEDGMRAEAQSVAGFMHAAATAAQLVTAYPEGVPCAVIEDSPRFKCRAVLLDVCRHFYGVPVVKKFIDAMALFKFDYLHLHLSDDQGFRLQIDGLPLLHEIGSRRSSTCGDGKEHSGYYTKEQVADIVAYAGARGIEVIPEIDVPGHMAAAIAAYPELSCSGEKTEVATWFGIHDKVLCAGKESTYDFLWKLLSETAEMFPCKYFHLGGDEVPKITWDECDLCKETMRREGLKNYEQLQGYFTNKAVKMLEKLGKTAVLWNESLYSGLVDKSAVIQYWARGAHSESTVARAVAEDGRKVIVSLCNNYYFDYPNGLTPLKKAYSFEPVLPEFGANGEDGVFGVECTLWTEHIADEKTLFERTYPRAAAVAESGWSDPAKDYADFKARLAAVLPLLDLFDIPHATIKESDPGPFARIKQLAAWGAVNQRGANKDSARNWRSVQRVPKDI